MGETPICLPFCFSITLYVFCFQIPSTITVVHQKCIVEAVLYAL